MIPMQSLRKMVKWLFKSIIIFTVTHRELGGRYTIRWLESWLNECWFVAFALSLSTHRRASSDEKLPRPNFYYIQETGFSRHHGGPIEGPPIHHSTIVLRGLREVVNRYPIMPRNASLPDSWCKFFPSLGEQHFHSCAGSCEGSSRYVRHTNFVTASSKTKFIFKNIKAQLSSAFRVPLFRFIQTLKVPRTWNRHTFESMTRR